MRLGSLVSHAIKFIASHITTRHSTDIIHLWSATDDILSRVCNSKITILLLVSDISLPSAASCGILAIKYKYLHTALSNMEPSKILYFQTCIIMFLQQTYLNLPEPEEYLRVAHKRFDWSLGTENSTAAWAHLRMKNCPFKNTAYMVISMHRNTIWFLYKNYLKR